MRRLLINGFTLPHLLVLLSAALASLYLSKAEAHLAVNTWHSAPADSFFRYFTHTGDGLFIFGFSLLFCLFSLKKSMILIAAFALSGGITQLIKTLTIMPRPSLFFSENGQPLRVVEGIVLHEQHSFPSGHTAAVFALCGCLALLSRNTGLQVLLFLLASLSAFSRVYLSQHFFVDLYVGSIIGMLSAMLCVVVLQRWIPEFYNKPLYQLKRV